MSKLDEIRAAAVAFQQASDAWKEFYSNIPVRVVYSHEAASESLDAHNLKTKLMVARVRLTDIALEGLPDLLTIAEAAQKVDIGQLSVYAYFYQSDHCADQECRNEVDAAINSTDGLIAALAKLEGE